MEGSAILCKEMQRSLKLDTYGTYQYTKLQPLSALSATTAGGDVTQVELPARVSNHYYDRLEFDISRTPTAVGTYATGYGFLYIWHSRYQTITISL